MQTSIEIHCSENTDSKFAGQIRLWAEEIVGSLAGEAAPKLLSIRIYRLIDELRLFFRREKEALGVVSEGETEFIATHEAWRGYPRIHICSEQIKNLSRIVVQGAVQHELAHAILHGTLEFYTFRYSRHLIAAGKTLGFDMQLLQQLVYLISIALKDAEVVRKLAETEFESGQIVLLEHMLSDTHDEHSVWDTISTFPSQRKMAVAIFLKVLQPIKTLIAMRNETGNCLLRLWEHSYDWLSEEERHRMMRFAANTASSTTRPFQNWLEETSLNLIVDPQL